MRPETLVLAAVALAACAVMAAACRSLFRAVRYGKEDWAVMEALIGHRRWWLFLDLAETTRLPSPRLIAVLDRLERGQYVERADASASLLYRATDRGIERAYALRRG